MNRSKLIDNLIKFGFTKAQARLYFAGLSFDKSLMAHLATKANVRRSTAYYLMKELLRRGFFIIKKIGKRNYYIASPPEKLLKVTKEREQLILSLMPALKSLRKNK